MIEKCVLCRGRDLVSTAQENPVAEPGEGETTQPHRKEWVRVRRRICAVRMFCVRTCDYERFGDSIRFTELLLNTCCAVLYSVSAEKEEQKKGEETCVASKSPDDQTASSTVDRRKNNCAVPATPHTSPPSPRDLPFLSRSPTRMGMLDEVGRTLTRENAEMKLSTIAGFSDRIEPALRLQITRNSDSPRADGRVSGMVRLVRGAGDTQPSSRKRQDNQDDGLSKMQTAKSLPVIRDQQLVRHFR